MQGDTPLGETLLLQINHQLLNISEPNPNKINICFDEISENLRHEVSNHELQKINYKTVISSLKGLHPNILKATLQKNSDELYVMTINVSYEFLPEISEQIIFSKREIKPEQSQEIALRNMKNYLKNTREQVKAMTNIQVLSGQISNDNQIYFPIPHQKMLITWSIKLERPTNNLMKAQLFYYNSVTKKKISSDMLPSEGIYMYYGGNQFVTELRFIVEQSDKYDNIMLEIQGKNTGSYVISIEKIVVT